MHFILSISVVGLYLAGLRRRLAECGRSLVAYRDGVVVECEAGALARKVVPGMALSEAKALLREDGRYEEVREEDFAHEQEAWMGVCLAYADGVEAVGTSSGFLDLRGHVDVGDVASSLGREVWRATGYGVRAGCAGVKWVSRLAERGLPEEALGLGARCVEVVDDAAGFISGFPTMALSPVPVDVREKLVYLGYRRIGQVAEAPLGVLTKQFGKWGVVAYESARGRGGEVVRANFPSASLVEELRFGEGVLDRLEVERGLDELAGRLSRVLRDRDQTARGMRVVLELEGGGRPVVGRGLSKAVQAGGALGAAAKYLAGGLLGGLAERVVGVRVVLSDIEDAGRVQGSLTGGLGARERAVGAELALRRVRGVYGDMAVRRAGEVEVPRRVRLLNVWKQTTGWRSS